MEIMIPFFIIAFAVCIYLKALLADKFQKIVELKGYKGYRVWAWVFWLGLVGMLITIALPDKSAKEALGDVYNQKEPNDIAEELPEL